MLNKYSKLSLFSLFSLYIFIISTIMLSFATPEYNHFTHTISSLAVEKYGYIMQVNFLQLAFALAISGYVFHKVSKDVYLKKVWLAYFGFSVLFLLILTIFPTDRLEGKDVFSTTTSTAGILHLSTVLLSFFTAPFMVNVISKYMKRDILFNKFANTTRIGGYILSLLCFLWTYSLFSGHLSVYLGIFQKLIILTGFIWLIKIHHIVYNNIK